jgi:2-(1,2-epoxy-1,2-dihydrophenyl)acetyl-CoA isomerase
MPVVEFTLEEGLALITLNRPDKLNAFTREMGSLLIQRLEECKATEIRAVYITGAGKGFSAGQDLAEAAQSAEKELSSMVPMVYNPIVRGIRDLEKPVVAAVNGVAAGAGANLAFCCDIVIAAKSASFIQAFSKIGLVPDTGGTFFLPRLAGWQKASALTMLGDKLTADDAERMGMIYKVFPDEEFAGSSLQIARRLASMPTVGLALTKRLLQSSAHNSLEEQLALEDRFQAEAGRTADYQEGTKAFLEKRSPRFQGK